MAQANEGASEGKPVALGYLARRLEASAARLRLARFGAERFEPAWLPLWAMGIGSSGGDPSGGDPPGGDPSHGNSSSDDSSDGDSSRKKAFGEPSAWLMASANTPRALLWPGALGPEAQPLAEDTLLAGTASPSAETFERLWLWERLARPRHWRLRVRSETLRRVALPLWLGYCDGRETRLIVLSGVSGEPLGALKPAVLNALARHASVDNQHLSGGLIHR